MSIYPHVLFLKNKKQTKKKSPLVKTSFRPKLFKKSTHMATPAYVVVNGLTLHTLLLPPLGTEQSITNAPDGERIIPNSQGDAEYSETWSAGYRHGTHKLYFKNQVVHEITFFSGKRCGNEYIYDEFHRIVYLCVWHKNTIQTVSIFSPSNQMLPASGESNPDLMPDIFCTHVNTDGKKMKFTKEGQALATKERWDFRERLFGNIVTSLLTKTITKIDEIHETRTVSNSNVFCTTPTSPQSSPCRGAQSIGSPNGSAISTSSSPGSAISRSFRRAISSRYRSSTEITSSISDGNSSPGRTSQDSSRMSPSSTRQSPQPALERAIILSNLSHPSAALGHHSSPSALRSIPVQPSFRANESDTNGVSLVISAPPPSESNDIIINQPSEQTQTEDEDMAAMLNRLNNQLSNENNGSRSARLARTISSKLLKKENTTALSSKKKKKKKKRQGNKK